MNVLYTSAEVSPYASTGGLAEVAASLPSALGDQGASVRVITPLYGFLDYDRHGLGHEFSFTFPHRSGCLDVHLHSVRRHGVPHYFLQCAPWFGAEHTPYLGAGEDYSRFIILCQLTLACAWELRQRQGWFPDILHANDWHCALIPFLLGLGRREPAWAGLRSLLTLHNLAYQGPDAGAAMYYCGIPARQQPDLVYQDLTDNLLATGIAGADVVTTVSPRYAQEIRTPERGHGLDGLIRTRDDDLHGILNGIDRERYNPATDPALAARFDVDTFPQRRGRNRDALRQRLGLSGESAAPLVAMVGRLDEQKGLQLALPVLRRFLAGSALQFLSLGDGDPRFRAEIAQMSAEWPGQVAGIFDYDDGLARQIYAGADLYLMPSVFEPCGIGQLRALRYGALPLVRATGGLADTVIDYDDGRGNSGTGFVLDGSEADALYHALGRALDTWHNRPAAWRRLQRRAMQPDFGWAKSARATMTLYRDVLDSEVTR